MMPNLKSGLEFSCFLLLNGTLKCWGNNERNQLDIPFNSITNFTKNKPHINPPNDPKYSLSNKPTTVVHNTKTNALIQSYSIGAAHVCALFQTSTNPTSDPYSNPSPSNPSGMIKCWGFNQTNQASPPTQYTTKNDIIKVSLGQTHSCSLDINQKVDCWGQIEHLIPQGVYKLRNNVVDVEAGGYHTCVLRSVGRDRDRDRGLIYRSDSEASIADTQDNEESRGSSQEREDESVESMSESNLWNNDSIHKEIDDNNYDQEKNKINEQKIENYNSNTSPINYDDTSNTNTFLNADMGCWGVNNHGESEVPERLNRKIAKMSLGAFHTCIVSHSAKITCFGSNNQKQLELNESGHHQLLAYAVSTGQLASCGVYARGELVCVGWNEAGQMEVPRDLQADVAQASLGTEFACALAAASHSAAKVRCWGDNKHNQCRVA